MNVATGARELAIVYLDYNATTPCDPQVVAAILPWFAQKYGNPSNGLHVFGREAARAVDTAREQVAQLLNCRPSEIVFTSGATESNNLAILGLARAHRNGRRNHIVTSAIEHKAALVACKALESEGYEVSIVPVDSRGRCSASAVESVVSDRTLLVTVQVANNEIGTLQDVRAIADVAHQRGALFHTDAAQAVGKVRVDVKEWDVDFLSMSAHKVYGPKGCGCLYIRHGARAISLQPLVYGGGQEYGIRAGTLNVPGIVGTGEACRIALELLSDEAIRLEGLRDAFEKNIQDAFPELIINGDISNRLPNTSSLSLEGVDADALLLTLPTLALGVGSACSSGAIDPSHVLQAIGLSRTLAYSTIRVSLGRFTTQEEVRKAAGCLADAIRVMKARM